MALVKSDRMYGLSHPRGSGSTDFPLKQSSRVSGDVIKYLVKSEPLNLVTEISSYVDLCSSRRGQRYIARVNHPLSGAHSHFYPPPGTIECINRGGEANNDIRGSA